MRNNSARILLVLLAFLTTATIRSQNGSTDKGASKQVQVENGMVKQRIWNPNDQIQRGNIVKRMEHYKIPGASAAVIHDGKISWSKGYGFTDENKTNPIVPETLFQCASIGKIITAWAALKLVEQGALDLDEDVNLKLTSWKIPENENTVQQKVTLRHLLSHSAGLTDEYGFPGYDPNDEIPTLTQILNGESPANVKKKLSVESVPGEKEKYSGAGYLVVQLLIEEVSGTSFAEFVQKNIFDPFEMTNSTYDFKPDIHAEASIASGHSGKGKALKKKKYNLYPEKAAAGPWTTPEDLARLVLALQRSHSENKALIREMFTPQINNKGLGPNLKGLDEPVAFWHAGQNLGYTALLYGMLDREEGAIVMVNSDAGEHFLQEFITSVADSYDWPVMKTEISLPISTELKSDLSGTYQNTDASVKLIVEDSGKELTARPADSKKGYPLYRIDAHHFTFQNAQDYYRLIFNSDEPPVENSTIRLVYTESIGKTVRLSKVVE